MTKTPNLIDQLRCQLQGDALAQLESAAKVIKEQPNTPYMLVAASIVHALHRQHRYEEFHKQFVPEDKQRKNGTNG